MRNNIGGNMTTVKRQNRSLILKMLKRMGAVSRVDIAKHIKLTPAAITILANEMVKEGIIKEIGQLEEEDKRSGRKKVLIDINYDYKYVIGINIEVDYVNIGVSNLKGEVIVYDRFSVEKGVDPEKLLKKVASRCMAILWNENLAKDNILGVGVGIVGEVDEIRGISKHAYGLWEEKVNVKSILEKELDIKVVVDNNVRVLALGEIDYHNQGEMKNIMFVKYGPGIGSSIVINNEIYYGSNKNAGEIGHTVVDYNGEFCRCGQRGCLETIASEHSIVNEVRKVFSENKTPVLYEICDENIENLNFTNTCMAADKGDKNVIDIVKNAILYTGISIMNAVKIIDPEKVILYGRAFECDYIFQELNRTIRKINKTEDKSDFVVLSQLNTKSNYVGAISLALREFFYNTGGI